MSSRPILISIEGNIGAGKSTSVEKLQQYIESIDASRNIVFLREPVDIWESIKDKNGENILEKFYKDQHRHAFPFQVMAYATRIALLRKAISENPTCKAIICERSLAADKHIFAKMLHDDGVIEPIHYQIYQKFCGELADEFGLDGIVYIDVGAEVCHERISKRSRQGESVISLDYLQKCDSYHDAWLNQPHVENPPIHRIDATPNVEYDLEDPTNLGYQWLVQIHGFIQELIQKHDATARSIEQETVFSA